MPEQNELEGMRNLIGESNTPFTFGQGQRKRDRLGEEEARPPAPAPAPAKSRAVPKRLKGENAPAARKPVSEEHPAQPETPIKPKAPEDLSEEEMRAVRGEPVQTTIYLWPDQKKHLALRKVHGRGDISEQVRVMLDRVGACDDQWAR